MPYRITTRDGTVLIVDDVDLEFFAAYLVSRGYPPVSIEFTNLVSQQFEPATMPTGKSGKGFKRESGQSQPSLDFLTFDESWTFICPQ